MSGSKDIHLTLEASNTRVMKLWDDGAFAVHPDMLSHSGEMSTMGKGAVYSTSIKQKLHAQSSTETEIITVYNLQPMILWTRLFLKTKGYKVKEKVLYQDNMSAVLLENKGKKLK